MLTLLFLSPLLATCIARAANDVAAQPRNMGRDPEFKRVCYYTNWSQYRKQPARYFPFNIDPFLCTHLIFAFAKIDYKGQLAPYEWNDIQYPHLYKQFTGLKKKNPHLKTLLAVGGWTHGSRPFTDMVKTELGRKSFIDQSVQYLRAHNFDGLDLDWEYPANRGSPEEDKKKFSLLVKEMRAAYEEEAERTGKERLLVTAAVGGGEKIVRSAYEVPVINKYLDFINLMSYDLHGSWSKVLGINAPLYSSSSPDPKAKTTSVDEVVKLWLELGASSDKLVMGIPTYGRSFTLCSEKQIGIGDKNCGPGSPAPYTRERGFVSYYEMSVNLDQGWTRVWLDDQMVPFAYNLRNKQWVGYDDVQSVKLKAQYIKHHKLAGAMVWAVDLDDFANLAERGEVYPLCKAIREVLEDADYPAFNPPPKLATTQKPKSSKQNPKKNVYKQADVTKKDISSTFDNLKTISKSPYSPPVKTRPMTSALTSRKTTQRPTTSTTRRPTRPGTTTEPMTLSTRAVKTSSSRSPYKRFPSKRLPNIWQRRKKQKKISTKVQKKSTSTTTTTTTMKSRTQTYAYSSPSSIAATTSRGRVSPTLPPVLTSSPKHPQWEPVVITKKGMVPTIPAKLKKSSKDLKKTLTKNVPLSRKSIPVKKDKSPVGLDQFKPKPTPKRSPFTPPSYLRKRIQMTTPAKHERPTYVANPRFPPKKSNDVFQATKAKSSTTETATPHVITAKMPIKPTDINVISKPKNEAYDNGNFFEALDGTSTTTSQPTTQYTHITWTNSNDRQKTTGNKQSDATETTTGAPKWKPPYSFKPWSITTRRTTVPTTTSITNTTTADTTTSSTVTSTSIPRDTPTTRARYAFRTPQPTTLKVTSTFTSTSESTVSTTTPVNRTTTSAILTVPTTRKPKYSFRPWSRTTRRTTPHSTSPSNTSPSSTSTTSFVTTTATTTIKPTTRARYFSFKPMTKTTGSSTTIKDVAFKPRMKVVTKSSSKTSTALPEFRPWTRKPTVTTTTAIPSSTRPFFLFAKLSTKKSTPSSRVTPRLRSTSRTSKLPSTLTTSDFVTIVKDITFPVKKSIKTTQSTSHSSRETTTKKTETLIPSSTPKLNSKSNDGFAAATWTAKPETSTTPLSTTSIKSRNLDLKPANRRPDSEYRKGYTKSTAVSTKASIPSTKSSSPSGPQKIFGWMTPSIVTTSRKPSRTVKTTRTPSTTVTTSRPSPTRRIRHRKISTTLTTQSTTKRRTPPTIPTEKRIQKPTSTKSTVTTTTSTNIPTVRTHKPLLKLTTTSPGSTTSESTHRPLMTHSMLEASLGLDHTHPTVKVSMLRKGIRHSELHRQHGVKLVHKPLPRGTPPPVVTLPTRTEAPYVLNIPKTSDCDNNDDVRHPDETLKQNQRVFVGNDFIPPRQKHLYEQRQQQQGYVIDNYDRSIGYQQPHQSYNVETRLKAWPKRLLQPTVRYHTPRKYINYRQQQRPQVGYNIPHKPMKLQPQRIVVDYQLPGGKYKTVKQSQDIKPKQQQRPVKVQKKVKKTDSSDFKCPSVFGIFPDRTDCRKFHQCVWFVPFNHICGKGTVWNDSMKICDWPKSVTSCLT